MKKSYIWFVCTVLWMVVIFQFSAQNAEQSSALSDGLVIRVLRVIYDGFDTYPLEQQEAIMGTFTFLVRKGAHFTEYLILGFFIMGWCNSVEWKGLYNKPMVAWIVGTVYAVSDELHQMFSDGRAPRVFDVLVDSIGVVAGILIFFLVCRILLWYTKYHGKMQCSE